MNKSRAVALARTALAHWDSKSPQSLAHARSIGPHTFRNLRCKKFLSEYCWVVYASGFRFAVIEGVFPSLRHSFKNFDMKALSRMRSIKPVLTIFNNPRKAESFLRGAKDVSQEGFLRFKRRVQTEGVDALESLPGLGPITKDHLAKNIGLADVPKGDIWLQRAASYCKASSVTELTTYLSKALGESQNVIDIALWRYGKDGYFPKQWE